MPCESKLFESLGVFAYSHGQAHIVEFVHSQSWEMGKRVQIFMPVADGSLRDYPSTKMEKNEVVLVSSLFYNTCIESRLCTEISSPYPTRTAGLTFLLADFGYAMRIGSEITCVETQIYLAPEVWFGAQKDFGLDIWSLGVVIYEISKKINFTRRSGLTDRILAPEDWCSRLERVCRNGGNLAEMVTFDNKRATAKGLYASPSFPDIPEDLPCIFGLPEK